MFETVAELQVPYVLMHMRGTPQTMSTLTHYDNLLEDLVDYFQKKIYTLRNLGVKDVIVDPGFGFAKTIEQNFTLLEHLDHLRLLEVPILAGLSRKSMIWRTLGITAEDALTGTIALNSVALTKGASLLRVHDVKEAVACCQLFSRLPVDHPPA
jgi:dihydropteroate synthase